MDNHSIAEEINIAAPIEEVFDLVTDPYKVPLVMPGLVEINNIVGMPFKVGSTCHFVFKMFGINTGGDWTVKVLDRPTKYESDTVGDQVSTWTYNLQSENGVTVLQVIIRYHVPTSLLGKVDGYILKPINDGYLKLYLNNIKQLLEK